MTNKRQENEAKDQLEASITYAEAAVRCLNQSKNNCDMAGPQRLGIYCILKCLQGVLGFVNVKGLPCNITSV